MWTYPAEWNNSILILVGACEEAILLRLASVSSASSSTSSTSTSIDFKLMDCGLWPKIQTLGKILYLGVSLLAGSIIDSTLLRPVKLLSR